MTGAKVAVTLWQIKYNPISVSAPCHPPYLYLASRFFVRSLPIADRHHWRLSIVQRAISQREIKIEGASLEGAYDGTDDG